MSPLQKDFEQLNRSLAVFQENEPEYLMFFGVRKYKPSELGISARNINNWSDNGLLPSNKKKGWHRFSLTECIWLKIIQNLRELNLPLDTIKNIKDVLFHKIDFENIFEDKEILAQLKNALQEKESETFIDIINSKELKELINAEQLTFLDNIVLDLIFTRSNFRLLFTKDGQVMLHKDNYEDYLYTIPEYRELLKSTHISISLNRVLADITKELIEDEGLKTLQILTDQELEIIDIIREKGIKKIEIYFGKDEKPELLKITKQNILVSETRLKELILVGGYQDIKITTEKGKIVNFENTKKIKL
jgi:DNA-binding transcriptional MerR regulator